MKKLTIRDDAGADAPRGAIRLPPMQPPRDVVIPDLPRPSDYWRTTPAVLGEASIDLTDRAQRRRRLIIGFAVAAVVHVALVLGWLLSPPLRLKAGYAPERWVPVLSLPAPAPAPAKDPAVVALPRPPDPTPATPPKGHARRRAETHPL